MFTRLSRRFIFAAALLASGLSAADTQAQGRPDKLVVGLLPGESAPTVMRLNEPLRMYLEKRLGIPVASAPTTPPRVRHCGLGGSISPFSGQ